MEELLFQQDSEYVFKDLSLLTQNRLTNFAEGEVKGEMIVIDTPEGSEACDTQHVTYLQGPKYDGKIRYSNLQYLNNSLRQYRSDLMHEQSLE